MELGRAQWFRRRPGALVGAVVSLAMAGGYFVFAFQVVFSMRLGPTAVTLMPGRGVHTGDVLALPSVVLGGVFLALSVAWFARAARRPEPLALVPRGWEARSAPSALSRAA